MANPVVVSDIAARWRTLTTAENDKAAALLDDAWALVKLKVPDIEDRIDDESLDVGIVRMVVSAMVLRVLKNPDGKQQESLDDYSYTMGGGASGVMYITADEVDMLEPQPVRPDGGFTIRPYGAPDDISTSSWGFS